MKDWCSVVSGAEVYVRTYCKWWLSCVHIVVFRSQWKGGCRECCNGPVWK